METTAAATDLPAGEAAGEAARTAHRAVKLALFALAVAVIVLWMDNRIKKQSLDEARRIQGLLGEARFLAEEVARGRSAASEAGEAGADPGGGVNAGDGVVHAAGASAAAGGDADGGVAAADRRA